MDNMLLIIIAIAEVVLAVFIGFMHQKMKNQADKEDLAELTEIVEDVKKKYNDENALLVANLNLMTNKKNILFTESKNYIIDFTTTMHQWFWLCYRIEFENFFRSTNQEIDDIIKRIYNFSDLSVSKFSLCQLLIDDNELLKSAHIFLLEQSSFSNYVLDLIYQFQKLKKEQEHLETLKEKGFNANFSELYYKSRLSRVEDEQMNIMKHMMNEGLDKGQIILEKQNIYIDKARKILKA